MIILYIGLIMKNETEAFFERLYLASIPSYTSGRLLCVLVKNVSAISGWDEADSLIPPKPWKMCIWKKKK